MTRRAYAQAHAFGRTLKSARDLARAGHCKPAKRAFKEATYMARDLVESVPNARGEVVRKLRMVENTLLEQSCRAPRFYPGMRNAFR